jgi:hypothetical protein
MTRARRSSGILRRARGLHRRPPARHAAGVLVVAAPGGAWTSTSQKVSVISATRSGIHPPYAKPDIACLVHSHC